jgi:hypothetical protein
MSRTPEFSLEACKVQKRRISARGTLTALTPGHPKGTKAHRNGNDRDAEVDVGFQEGHGFRSLKISFAIECRMNPTKSQMMLTRMAIESLAMASDP